jgi:hypothetical protein
LAFYYCSLAYYMAYCLLLGCCWGYFGMVEGFI